MDDPVSSLDHRWRERIAHRLALEANTRQVIVFTHDLVLLRALLEECDREGVGSRRQYVRRDGDGCGISSPDLPWVAMRVKERVGVLRRRQQEAAALYRKEGTDAYEPAARELYGLLREAWEQAVVEVLLNDVVARYRPSIQTQKVQDLYDITKDDRQIVDAGMTECSRWLRGHDHPPADNAPFPAPDELLAEIQQLDDWVLQIRRRRESKKPPSAIASPKPTS